jgi:alpha-ketoglutarate-dependent taurine dioxygenase
VFGAERMPHHARVTGNFGVVKLGANIGARIDGVQLGDGVDGATIEAINIALLEHKVIFFRDQHDLDDEDQLAFASKLGTPTTAHPTLSRGASASWATPHDIRTWSVRSRWRADHSLSISRDIIAFSSQTCRLG